MRIVRLSRRQRLLANCAPISEELMNERSMRAAVFRARASDEFANQQSFDRAVVTLVRSVPVPPEIGEWFSSEDLVPRSKWKWKMAQNPAVLAVAIALAVIDGVFVLHLVEHRHGCPGPGALMKLWICAAITGAV